ncbi:MAG: biotin--[acetyl-CoA-carboxylase] ligase [Gemmatimonadetes bacterium]|nr:biotin--[acetyl-CoA-carboxylase] ligase [Gemmatimonadota bacterium]NNM04842.1 biotin--[acetyl-CoA-carboxylase] ligase [Gemmatimonadota bacterium]
MAIYTDNPQFAKAFLPPEVVNGFAPADTPAPTLTPLFSQVFGDRRPVVSARSEEDLFSSLLLSEHSKRSQYDQLIELARTEAGLPDRVACLAGAGDEFHGFKGRPWRSVQGNLHLAVHLAPKQEIDRFAVAFTILAALSVTESLTQIVGLEKRPRIKWVNDILLGGAKVGGVLAYTQSQGEVVTSAVLGIGINLEARPRVEPTPFVPAVAAVRDFLPGGGRRLREAVLWALLETLDRNYRVLEEEGVSPLLDRYRSHSLVLGREVRVCSEGSDESLEVLAEGRVTGLGENLELYLDGRNDPISGGRLIVGPGPSEG